MPVRRSYGDYSLKAITYSITIMRIQTVAGEEMKFIFIPGHYFASTESQILLKNLIVVNFFATLIN